MSITPSVMIPSGLGSVQQVTPKRVLRSPVHTFSLSHKPFQIQPFMIAPVLPGETLKNLMLQARVVSDSILNPLTGWWLEYYFFYVPLRALGDGNDGTGQTSGTNLNKTVIESMLLDLSAPLSDSTIDSVQLYQKTGVGVDFVTGCLNSITNNYFRGDDDTTAHTVDGLPIVRINGKSWLDSYYNDDEIPAGTSLDVTSAAADITMQELDTKYQTWLTLRQQKMTELTYEDYLRTFGVNIPKADQLKPELIRYVREWSYPTNTVNTLSTDGEAAVGSAMSWSIMERADKDRFFREPGFIFGVTVARPKVYLKNQDGYAAAVLKDTLSWLPALMKDRPETSLKKITQATGPLKTMSDALNKDYWIDVRDLFVHGDQFISHATTATDRSLVDLPKTDHETSMYVSSADITALFLSGSDTYVRQDGVVDLKILGTQMDHT